MAGRGRLSHVLPTPEVSWVWVSAVFTHLSTWVPLAFIPGCGDLESEIALSLGLADIWGYLQEWRPPAVWLFEAPCIRERTTVLLLWDYPVFRLRMKDKPRDKVTHPKWKSSFSACEFWSPVYKKCCLFKIYCRYSSPTLLLPITAFTVAAWDQSS